MSDSTPTVITVKSADVVSMTAANAGNAAGVRKADNNAGKAWGITVLWLHGKVDLRSFDDSKDVKEIAEDVRKAFKDEFLVDYAIAVDSGDKPEINDELLGTNARTGKTIPVLDGKGEIKWSSWDQTKLSVGYCGDIAKVIDAGLLDELLVGATKVMGRNEILARCKVAETPLETIIRNSEMSATKAKELGNEADVRAALAEVAKVVQALNDNLTARTDEETLDKAA